MGDHVAMRIVGAVCAACAVRVGLCGMWEEAYSLHGGEQAGGAHGESRALLWCMGHISPLITQKRDGARNENEGRALVHGALGVRPAPPPWLLNLTPTHSV